MKVLITGSGGQLGFELVRSAPADVQLLALDRRQCDLTDEEQLRTCLKSNRPQIIINAAAYTAVDRAEQEPGKAAAVNSDGPRHLARLCAQAGIRLLHVSTDFVFDGERGRPYRPQDKTRPLGIYGRSKRDGERAVLDREDLEAIVVRTAWVYSQHGRNFVKRMIELMRAKPALRVVCDQVSTPTWANDLASALWFMARAPGLSGLYHFSNTGIASWYDFAVAIQEEATSVELLHREIPIVPIASSEYPTPAARPAFSALDCGATWHALGGPAPYWRVSLRHMLSALKKDPRWADCS